MQLTKRTEAGRVSQIGDLHLKGASQLISVLSGRRGLKGSRLATRTMKQLLLAAIGLAVVASGACGGDPPMTLHRLSSGKTIRVLSVGKMHFSHDQPALVLRYQTDLNVDQQDALRAEVTEIWRDFRKEADKANMTGAIIMANEVPKGRFIQRGRSFNFVFEKRRDGTWPEEPPAASKQHAG
jgi:hypothetical protein